MGVKLTRFQAMDAQPLVVKRAPKVDVAQLQRHIVGQQEMRRLAPIWRSHFELRREQANAAEEAHAEGAWGRRRR